jgi:DNA polymerase elongation subunit (family B)
LLADEWLWGWDPTPGIVSVWAESDGRATVWRRVGGALVREESRFRPWLLLAHRDDVAGADATIEELAGDGALRFLVRARNGRVLAQAVLDGAARRLGRRFGSLRELPASDVLVQTPEDQYLAATGRTHFRGLGFDDVRRLQLDLETTGLDPARDRIFLAAIREPDGRAYSIEGDEAAIVRGIVEAVRAADPDAIENHNLHGFDLPFLEARARTLGVPLALGRIGGGLRKRAAPRGLMRFTIPGRECIDTLDAVRRHEFATRELPGLGLKAVARFFGLAAADREVIAGERVADVYARDPARVRRYAEADVHEAAGIARMLGGAAFALAQMAPRRYERLADAGPATGVLDPLLVRAYLRAGQALPAHATGDGTPHQGANLYLFATGVAPRVVKADVASLYPSLMRQYRIGSRHDRLGALLSLVDRLVEQRLAAKAAARAAVTGSAARHSNEALSAAMKLVINSAYGYLAATGLTRFADVHAANEVTRHGREVLDTICTELAARGLTLLEGDTDGVYASAPAGWTEADERRAVAEVAALLPPRVKLEFDGRYAAMLSHEPKNYALAPYGGGPVVLRGVAFRSSRAEPFGEAFLRRALACLLAGDVAGAHAAYVATVGALRAREVPTVDVSARVRLSRTPAEYLATRDARRELSYEAVLGAGRTTWAANERVRVYRATAGRAALVPLDDEGLPASDPRDYDIEHYVRVLHDSFASRLVRALAPDDFAAAFADPRQLSLFARPLAAARPILDVLPSPIAAAAGSPSA